jgi:hypothetical protein
MLDAATHIECLGFIRAAIAEADRTTAHHTAGILKDVCQRGYADRAAIWRDLTDTEKQQFQELLIPIAHHFAKRIKDAIGWNSPGVALGIDCDLRGRDRQWRIGGGGCGGGCGRSALPRVSGRGILGVK